MVKINRNLKEKKQKKSPRKKVFKRPIHQYSEEALLKALKQIRENNLSIRKASQIYGVPKTTIHDRLSGRIAEMPRRMGPAPVLSTTEEKALVEWCINLAKCGFPQKMDDVLNTVQKIILSKSEDDRKKIPFVNGRPGKKWYSAFFRRNPQLVHRNPENLSKGRAVLTEESIRKWFTCLREYLETENAVDILDDATRIFNGDESSFTLCPKTGKIIAPRGYRNVYQIVKGKEKEALTVLILISAAGAIPHPCVVFPYVRPPKDVRESMDPSWCLGLSETGWMRSEVFYEYVANSFNQWLEANGIKKPILFFIDGHKSHLTMSLSEFCSRNGIILYALPPNATHIMQPCDVSVFKPLKSQWQITVREWQICEENTNQVLTKSKFCPLLKKVLEKENLPQTIKNGFRRCGLFPFDPNAVDYTKCVQNVLENLEKATTDQCNTITDPNTPSIANFEITEQTIKHIQGSLEDRGVDVKVIFEELSKSKRFLTGNIEQEENTPIPETSVNDILLLTDDLSVTTYDIDEAGFLIAPPQEMQETIQSLETNTELLEEFVFIPDYETVKSLEIQDNEFVPISNNEADLPQVASSSIIIPSPKISHISQVLLYPKPILKGKKNKNAPKMPSAISSEMWRQMEKEKEDAKQRKIDAVRSRKEESQKRREAKQLEIQKKKNAKKMTKKRTKRLKASNEQLSENNYSGSSDENIPDNKQLKERKYVLRRNKTDELLSDVSSRDENEQLSKKDNKIKCSLCDIDLISDTEENDLKNIGCDECTRWYHLKCTTFKGHLYDEIFGKDFTCSQCTQ